jgi:uncharacterized BrkB/YihY/UPF0761 family membrane protein
LLARPASLGSVGLLVLGITALVLMLTIDRTLNGIWRVRQAATAGAAGAGVLGCR